MQSYIIDLKDLEAHNIDNIVDMQFLHGYYDPTLAILYEPIKTFSGYVFSYFYFLVFRIIYILCQAINYIMYTYISHNFISYGI